MKTLSFLIPFLNERENLPHLLAELSELAKQLHQRFGLSCSVLLIDDGSTDGYEQDFKSYAPAGLPVRVIVLSRNFGKEAALSAGIDHAHTDAVVIMDADLQHPPELVHRFIEEWQDKNTQVVFAYKADRRGEPLFYRVFSTLYYRLINADRRVVIPKNASDFRLLDRTAVEALRLMPERERFMKGMYAWVGFTQSGIAYTPKARHAGRSKWSALTLYGLSIDGLVSFSVAPIRMIVGLGFLLGFLSIIYGLKIIAEKLIHGIDVPGFPTLAVIMAFFFGIQFVFIGLIGEYIAKLTLEVKRRPIYLKRSEIVVDACAAQDARNDG